MSDDIEEVRDFEALSAEQDVPATDASPRFPRWVLYAGALVLFNAASYVFDWGWVLW
ncbi:MAG: hypothetical protein VX265_06145 [Myxococcota bacterium]|nr:hypothetical protein [Myxococcota bacterium]